MNKETIDAAAMIIENHLNGTQPAAPGCKSQNQLVRESANVLMVMADDILDINDDRRRSVENRYLVFGIMAASGYTHQQIADYFKMNRENITKALTKLDGWLRIYDDTKGNFQRLVSRIL